MATNIISCGCATSHPISTSRWSTLPSSLSSATSSPAFSPSTSRRARGAECNLQTRSSSPWSLESRGPRRRGFVGSDGSSFEGTFGSGEGPLRAATKDDDIRDDGAAINELESYLGDMSLEYDSVWDTKPAWCQPWTIVGTGVGVVATSWILLHNVLLTGGATTVIGLWWYMFLYQYPLGYTQMIAERRKQVEEGSEDTYGRRI